MRRELVFSTVADGQAVAFRHLQSHSLEFIFEKCNPWEYGKVFESKYGVPLEAAGEWKCALMCSGGLPAPCQVLGWVCLQIH